MDFLKSLFPVGPKHKIESQIVENKRCIKRLEIDRISAVLQNLKADEKRLSKCIDDVEAFHTDVFIHSNKKNIVSENNNLRRNVNIKKTNLSVTEQNHLENQVESCIVDAESAMDSPECFVAKIYCSENQSNSSVIQPDNTVNQPMSPLNESDYLMNSQESSINDQYCSGNHPECSGIEPEYSVNQQECPIVEPEYSVNQQECLIVEPEYSVNQQMYSAMEPDYSVNQQECPITEPDESWNESECSIMEQEDSVNQQDFSIIQTKKSGNESECSIIEAEYSVNPKKCSITEPEYSANQQDCYIIQADESGSESECSIIEPEYSVNPEECSIVEPEYLEDQQECSIIEPEYSVNQQECSIIEPEYSVNQQECSIVEPEYSVNQQECSIIQTSGSGNESESSLSKFLEKNSEKTDSSEIESSDSSNELHDEKSLLNAIKAEPEYILYNVNDFSFLSHLKDEPFFKIEATDPIDETDEEKKFVNLVLLDLLADREQEITALVLHLIFTFSRFQRKLCAAETNVSKFRNNPNVSNNNVKDELNSLRGLVLYLDQIVSKIHTKYFEMLQ